MSDSNKKQRSIRIWTDVDIDEIKQRLLLIDDLYGSCAACKQLGLNYLKNDSCPNCKTKFKYLATNSKNPGEIAKILNRIQKEGLNLKLIDRSDFEKASAKDALGDLFS